MNLPSPSHVALPGCEGSIKVNDTLELPELKLQRKVKSMQMFRQPVQKSEPPPPLPSSVASLRPFGLLNHLPRCYPCHPSHQTLHHLDYISFLFTC